MLRRTSHSRHYLAAAAAAALLDFAMHGAAQAQTPGQTVTWTVSTTENAKPGARITLKLQGSVADGWHVYALDQLPDGPTPMRVTLDPSEIATLDGAAVGTPSIRQFDKSFKLDTQYYDKPFAITVPVRLAAKLPAGAQSIPVGVRFQTCNGQTCQPPKTLHLSALIDVKAGE